ncbi:tetratricopeptide repeat protein [Kitasatospora sp. MAA4]|uniref:ATP-binding protein n=1 Tax=Kitasatospora sp. MAA4 TaxID=3035093 RepID=UPI002473E721|nr:tetratricopeptide repeat protein [Kitasatospora sp. MAA4]
MAVPENTINGGTVGASVMAGVAHVTIQQPPEPAAAVLPLLPEPAPLPSVPPGFTGREDEVDGLLDLLGRTTPGDDPEVPAVVVTAVAGMGGIGKTTLALAAGRDALRCGLFTGALFLDLQGYDDTPVEAGQALDGVLRALGVAVEQIPPEDHARAALYRAQLQLRTRHGQRILVIADNASHLGQVQHLLPPADGPHRLLVTSRDDLPGLGARLLDLDVLAPEPAARLIRTAIAIPLPKDTRVADDPAGAARVAELCGFLPLALQIAAAQLVAERHLKPAQLADDLDDIDGRLDVLDDGSRTVRAVLDRSYRRLAPTHAELFRILALNPGPDVSTESVVGFTGAAKARDVRARLTALARASLIRQDAESGRWRMHDLVRAYATERAHAHPAAAAAALRRILEYYDRTAWEANAQLDGPPARRPRVRFQDRAEALAWFDEERENAIAAVHSALGAGRFDIAHGLPTYLAKHLSLRRRLGEWLTIAIISRDAANATENRHDQAGAGDNLGIALRELGRFHEAADVHQSALVLYQDLGDQHGAAGAWDSLGIALQGLGRFEEAADVHRSALALYQDLGDQQGTAGAWDGLGAALRGLGRFEEAVDAHQIALATYLSLSDEQGVARAWNNLGNALEDLGRFQEAADAHLTALAIHQDLDDQHSAATAWNNAGVALRGLELFEEATAAANRAVAIFRELRDARRGGEALDELADTLRAAGHPAADVRSVREESADAYRRAGAADKAADVLAKPDE